MIGDYCGLQRQLQRRLKRATDGSGWKEKAPACVQSMDISLAFKMGDMANISVKSVVKQRSLLAMESSYTFKRFLALGLLLIFFFFFRFCNF